ncbi:MAG: hypothetical protein JF615_15565, partial [Asticcacaulis sp.]|nr:hypothetical protein [Asticcacaulis sp.]
GGEEAEKIRKAEAAAALMRLYSPYGGGALGKPLAGPLVKPVAPAPAPAPAEEFTNQSVIAPQAAQSSPIEISSQPMSTRPAPPAEPEDAEEEDESSALVMPTVPGVAASAQPAPVITAFNSPYARPIPRPELTKVEPVPAPEIVEVPRPVAVDLSAPSASKIFENPQAAPNWREQLQRPLPEGYAAPEVVQPEQQASLVQNGRASRYEQMYEDDNEAWTIDGDRIALSSEEMHEEGASWGKMIISTLWWIFFSAIGLAALGVAAAAYFKSKDPSVLRIGAFDDYMKVSVISAAIGIFFVSVSVWLIMKRLGGLKD